MRGIIWCRMSWLCGVRGRTSTNTPTHSTCTRRFSWATLSTSSRNTHSTGSTTSSCSLCSRRTTPSSTNSSNHSLCGRSWMPCRPSTSWTCCRPTSTSQTGTSGRGSTQSAHMTCRFGSPSARTRVHTPYRWRSSPTRSEGGPSNDKRRWRPSWPAGQTSHSAEGQWRLSRRTRAKRMRERERGRRPTTSRSGSRWRATTGGRLAEESKSRGSLPQTPRTSSENACEVGMCVCAMVRGTHVEPPRLPS
mmetsp:Transcript_45699/g.129033  ORF Transcript_45699/g.129033 Transcript_45699/m.129033 type:complete len:248 (-) Transcript_45699:327-1070(-)